jgi:hypothetical protein
MTTVEPLDLDGVDWRRQEEYAASLAPLLSSTRRPMVLGIAREELPPEAAPVLTLLDCTLGTGPAPYCAGSADDLAAITEAVTRAPLSAATLVQVLALTEHAGLKDGLTIESLAYSMLLGGPEFRAWRGQTPRRTIPDVPDPVLLERTDTVLVVILNRPERRNAFGRAVRDGLVDALELAALDPSIEEVVVRGAGPSYCSGGDLDEFGSTEPALAHLVRLERSPGRAVSRLGDRVRFELHGACVGAGIEVPAFASRVSARADARLWLPELRMGLIPGAGGTVSITRRIGRWRTAWLALTGEAIDAQTALDWGLVDELC